MTQVEVWGWGGGHGSTTYSVLFFMVLLNSRATAELVTETLNSDELHPSAEQTAASSRTPVLLGVELRCLSQQNNEAGCNSRDDNRPCAEIVDVCC